MTTEHSTEHRHQMLSPDPTTLMQEPSRNVSNSQGWKAEGSEAVQHLHADHQARSKTRENSVKYWDGVPPTNVKSATSLTASKGERVDQRGLLHALAAQGGQLQGSRDAQSGRLTGTATPEGGVPPDSVQRLSAKEPEALLFVPPHNGPGLVGQRNGGRALKRKANGLQEPHQSEEIGTDVKRRVLNRSASGEPTGDVIVLHSLTCVIGSYK